MNKILLGLLAVLLLLPATASAATKNPAGAGFRTCPSQGGTGWKCATLRYPLDPSGRRAGRVTMRAKLRLAPGSNINQAIFALAGGPGQAAVPLAEGFDDVLGGLTAGYDLVVPDPRGTLYLPRGEGSARDNPFAAGLMCWTTLSESTADTDPTQLVADCAKELGPQRAYYTTQHTVRDLERLRQQLGYDKIVLYGTSYGTKTALDYARSYPQHVQKLILDSSLDQLDPLSRNSLQAIPRALEELCIGGACNGITSDIRGDWSNAVTRLSREPITDSLVGGGVGWRIEVADLVNLLFSGDFYSSSRLQLPAALAALRAGWVRPLVRLAALNGVGQAVPRDPDPMEEGVDAETFLELNPVLYLATACGDINAPWARRDRVKVRVRKLGQAAASSLEAQPLPGWDAERLAQTSEASSCLGWPDARRRQLPTTQPQVPVILLSGRQDVRTPLEDSQRLQGQIANSRLQSVSFVGHSVLGGELEGCANRALRGFMRDTAAPDCSGDDPGPLFQLVDPRRENYAPDPAVPGEPGQTVSAVRATLLDLWQQMRSDADNGYHLVFSSGWIGLEDGQAVSLPLGMVIDQPSSVLLGSYSSVRGVKLSGRVTVDEQFKVTGGRLIVRGDGAIGSINVSAEGLDGRLDGQTVHAAPLSYPQLPAPVDNPLLPRWRPTPGLGHAPMLTHIRKR